MNSRLLNYREQLTRPRREVLSPLKPALRWLPGGFLLPTSSLPIRPVVARWRNGGTPGALGRHSHVDRVTLWCTVTYEVYFLVTLCGCGTSAFWLHSLRTQYCWPVSGPDWFKRGRLRSSAPVAMQAFTSCSVSEGAVLFGSKAEAPAPVALLSRPRVVWFGVGPSVLLAAAHAPYPVAATATLQSPLQDRVPARARGPDATGSRGSHG